MSRDPQRLPELLTHITEQRNAFRDVAQQRYAQIIASGDNIPWSEMRDYLTERAAGKTPPRPQPRKLGR